MREGGERGREEGTERKGRGRDGRRDGGKKRGRREGGSKGIQVIKDGGENLCLYGRL